MLEAFISLSLLLFTYDMQSPDEIIHKSLRSSDGSRTCEDFLSAVQMWLNKIQVFDNYVIETSFSINVQI